MRNVSISIVLCSVLLGASGTTRADLLVASNYGNKVLRYDETTGVYLGIFASVTSPIDIIPDGTGNIWVSSFQDILSPPSRKGRLTRYNPFGGAVLASYLDASIPAGPIALTSHGDMLIADFLNDRVTRFDTTTGVSLGNFIPPGSGSLDGPSGLTFGPDGDLYVSSSLNGSILRYNGITGDFLNVFAVPGGNGPQDLTFGPDGSLYVAVDGAQRVYRYDPVTGAPLGTYAIVHGTPSDGMSMAFNGAGALFVTISGTANAVERFLPGGASAGYFVQQGSGGLNYPMGLIFTSMVPEPLTMSMVLPICVVLRMRKRSSRGCAVHSN